MMHYLASIIPVIGLLSVVLEGNNANFISRHKRQNADPSTTITNYYLFEDPASAVSGSQCRDAKLNPGTCESLQNCAPLYDEYKTKPSEDLVKYIIQSSCPFDGGTYSKTLICCAYQCKCRWFLGEYGVEDPVEPVAKRGLELLPENCGQSDVTSIRIGEKSKIGAWPWLAALGYRLPRNRLEFRCGGSLVTTQHVITAAHCVFAPRLRFRSDLTTIRLGEHDFRTAVEARHEDFNIESRIIHKNYDESSLKNDIAILKMDIPVTFRSAIQPLCLPVGNFFLGKTLEGIPAFVAGWGKTAYKSTWSPFLKEEKVPIRNNAECHEAYAIFNVNVTVNRLRLCAMEADYVACRGDSGGPLMVVDTDQSRFAVAGVFSMGFKCGEKDYPGIYTRVTEYLDWLDDNLL